MAAKNDIVYRLAGEDKLSPVINKTKKEIDGLSDKGKRLNEIKEGFDKMSTSNASLGKKISQCRKYMDELAQSGQRNTAVYKQLAEAAQKYDKQLKEVNKDIKGVKGFDLKGMMGGITDKMGLGNVGAAIANPYVLAGAAIAGASKALFDYNAELDRSLQKTEQFTGLSGDALMQLRNGIKATADTYGKDYDTVLASVDGLMSQFGIDAQEALKIINKGFQGGADDAGKMLDMINQYSGSFKDAGISAAEMVAVIGNTRSGIFSEEGMQLFQKGAKNVREFSDNLKASLEGVGINAEEMYRKLQSGEISTVQAIQQISAKLKGLNPQSQEVGEVLKQVFGKVGSAAGMELVTALSEVETNLDVIAKQTGETGQAFENLRKANEEFEAALASLFGTSNKGFSTMITQLKADLFGAIAKVINKFIDLYNESIIVRYGIQSIAIAFKNAWEIIKAILKLFMNSLKSLGGMIEGVLTLDWKKVVSSWQNGVKNTLKTVADGFANIKDNIANGLEETLHGQMQKITVSSEVEGYTKGGNGGSSSNGGGNGNSNVNSDNKGGKGSKTTVKEEKIKTQYEIDKESLDAVNKKLQEAMSGFNTGLISKEQLEATAKEANDYYKEHGIKAKVDLEYSTDKNGFEQVKIAVEKDALTPLQELEKAYKDAEKELNSIDPFNTPKEKVDELKQKLIDAKNTFEDAKKALSTEVTASIGGVDNNNFIKGSLTDKRMSMANANARAEQVKSDKEAGLITAEQARAELAKIQDEINAAFPGLGLTLDLHINEDGSITTALEDIEKKVKAVGDTAGYIGQLGSAFQTLGSAIGGAGGEIVSFGGQVISQSAAMVAQLAQIIAANQAAALAKGISSGAGLQFPFNLAAIATIVGTITSLFASLPTFETGGIVGGTSFKGDKVLARVNSGEAIINQKQQNRMMDILNGADYGSDNNGFSGGTVKFEIDGKVLKGVLNNYNNKISKQS